MAQSAWTLEWVATSGAVRKTRDVLEAGLVHVREVDHDAEGVAETNDVLARLGQPGTDVGAPGKLERHAVAENRRPAPHRADRAKAHIVEEVERIEIGADRFGAFHVHHARDLAAAERRADRRGAAADSEVVGRGALHPVQQARHREGDGLRGLVRHQRRQRHLERRLLHQRHVVDALVRRRHVDGKEAAREPRLLHAAEIEMSGTGRPQPQLVALVRRPMEAQQEVVMAVEEWDGVGHGWS